uniref:Uncharacterized protein n=1 Tax=candidate division WOR-3 bacterium TaxID=2052148 RepID=A0A7C3Z2Z1_UNCW3
MIRRILIGFLLFAGFCFQGKVLKGAEGKAMVGRYEDFFLVSGEGDSFKQDVARWRKEIERDNKFLVRLARKYFPVPEESEFQFKFVGRDTVNHYLFLRYFAPLLDPKGTIAGWQILFLFSEKDKTLKRILISEVPLED